MSRALALCAALLALGACDQVKKLDTGGGGSSNAVPDAVQLRLTQSCAIPGCHVAGLTPPDLSAESGGAWVDQAGTGGPYVTFGDTANSYLVQKLFPSPSVGSQMPLAPGVLTPEDAAVIVGWVAGVDFPTGDTDGPSSGSSGGSMDTMDSGSESGDSGSDLTLCSLEAVGPGTSSPVVSGDEAGKIPASVGAALERNCGCHYVTTASPPYVPYSAGTQLQVLANFTGPYGGANGTYTGMPGWVAVQDRVINQRNMPMAQCETDGGGSISDADFALFEAWFEQEAPDGANFTPP